MDQSFAQRVFLGSLIADAYSMPVHWYYNTLALDRDYPELGGSTAYLAPRNPHPDSILWRSVYRPLNPQADILGQQAQYWGRRGVHYHQFLAAGQNTVNYQLARELYIQVLVSGQYSPSAWLERYIRFMREPDNHQDTYVEEYHRAFFNRLASGRKPMQCGIDDIHIGGLSQVPALFAALIQNGVTDAVSIRHQVRMHIELTHKNREVVQAGDTLVRLLLSIYAGKSIESALKEEASGNISLTQFRKWSARPDRQVIGQTMSPACYIFDSFPASLYLAWKYQEDFMAGICANAQVGGDNCHRGAVVGSILGAANPLPPKLVEGLKFQIGSEPSLA